MRLVQREMSWERRKVFEKVLEAYASSLRTLAEAQLTVNNQTTEINRLKGICLVTPILCSTDPSFCADISGFPSFSAYSY